MNSLWHSAADDSTHPSVSRWQPVLGLVPRVTRYSPRVCVLAPLLFNEFITAVIHVAVMRFEANKDIIDAFMSLGNKLRVWTNDQRPNPGDITMGYVI